MQASLLVDGLKQELKLRDITYADLASKISMSEASIKRMFAQKNFTLQRLDQILLATGISLLDIARHDGQEARLLTQLSYEQESVIVSNPKILIVAVSVLNTMTLEQMLDAYVLTKAEVIQYLLELDKLGFIELLPNNRVKLLVSRTFTWLPQGPIQNYFKNMAASDYLDTAFDAENEVMRLVNLMLTPYSVQMLTDKLNQLAKEFSQIHLDELKLPYEKKLAVSVLLACRPWVPDAFRKLTK